MLIDFQETPAYLTQLSFAKMSLLPENIKTEHHMLSKNSAKRYMVAVQKSAHNICLYPQEGTMLRCRKVTALHPPKTLTMESMQLTHTRSLTLPID